MNINYKEAQFEFFPSSQGSPDETKRPHFLAARLTLSVENLVIWAIVSIMVILFSFSLGVERGKRISFNDTARPSIDDGSTASAASGSEPGAAAKSLIKDEKKTTDLKSTVVQPEKTRTQITSEIGPSKAADKGVLAKGKDQKDTAQALASVKPGSGYTIQVGSYKTEKIARKEASSLKQKGFQDVFLLSKGSYVILCIGSFQKKEEASLFGKKLKNRYQDFVVRRL